MCFNASKCQVLQVTNKRKIIPASYTIHGQKLEVVNSAKYLGVSIDKHLDFNTHIDTIAKKAKSTRAFFARNLHHTSQKVKEAVYTTFIRPTVEYAASSWDPHTQKNITKLDKVQRSSARYVKGDYSNESSVDAMLKDLSWPSLENRRLQNRLCMMYKISTNLVDVPKANYLTPLETPTRGHNSRFSKPYTKSTAYLNSYFLRTIKDWNLLPFEPANCPSLTSFKSALSDAYQL